jgi:hypothetical protein
MDVFGIKAPMYLSPDMVIGEDKSGQKIAGFRFSATPNEKQLSLMDRAINLCNMEFLENPYTFKGRWCCKLKLKDGYYGE